MFSLGIFLFPGSKYFCIHHTKMLLVETKIFIYMEINVDSLALHEAGRFDGSLRLDGLGLWRLTAEVTVSVLGPVMASWLGVRVTQWNICFTSKSMCS